MPKSNTRVRAVIPNPRPPVSDAARNRVPVSPACVACGADLAHVSSGDSGYHESDWVDSSGNIWCPDAGPFRYEADWAKQEFPTFKKPNPEFSGYQYHQPYRDAREVA